MEVHLDDGMTFFFACLGLFAHAHARCAKSEHQQAKSQVLIDGIHISGT